MGAAGVRFPRSPSPSRAMPYPTVGSFERLDPAFDDLVPEDARIELLAEGFDWSEGPVWRSLGRGTDGGRGDDVGGYLLFDDIPKNTTYRWKEGEGLRVFLRPSGY